MAKTNADAKGVWILTSENNDYNQNGAYFRGVFDQKPTLKQLAEFFAAYGHQHYDVMQAVAFLEHMIAGGGRRDVEDEWFNLEFVTFGKAA